MAEEIFAHWRWKGSDPEKGKPGVLRIEPDGSMELNMQVDLSKPDRKSHLILGRGKSGEFFSLTGRSLYIDFDLHSGINSVSTVSVDQLLEGIELSEVDEPVFNRIELSFRNLLAVRNGGNFTMKKDESSLEYTIQSKNAIAPLHACTQRGKLCLCVECETSSSSPRGGYTVYDQVNYSVQFPSTKSWDVCVSQWYRPLMDLTSFMAQRSCGPLYVRASGPKIPDRAGQHWITVRGRWFNLNDDDAAPIFWRDAISNFSEEPGEFERLINEWLDLHAKLDRSLSAYLANEWEKIPFVENRFLFAAMAAEGYHRCMHGDPEPNPKRVKAIKDILENVEPDIRDWLKPRLTHIHDATFRDRITALKQHVERHIGNDLFSEEFVGRVVDARNALTHHNKDSAKKAPSDTLRILADTVQVILTICIAEDLGLDLETCKKRMQDKLDYIRRDQYLLKEDADS